MSTGSHRVHGIDGRDIPPDWPPLEPAEIEAILGRYALPGPLELQWRSPRPLSAAALVRAGERELFVKRHHRSVRSPATLAEEHRFIAHLRARGTPVVEILRDASSASAVADGDWTWEVHARAAGRDLYRELQSWEPMENLAHARAAGAALARLHQAATDYAASQRSTHILVTRCELLLAAAPAASLAAQLPERPALADFLARASREAELRVQIWPRQHLVHARAAAEPRLWTHNDWHASNLFWNPEGEVATILDFGLASPTFALFDLATAIERNAIAWLRLPATQDIGHAATARALVAGYRSVTALSGKQLALVADLLPVLHLDFALSEIEYFTGILHDPARAEAAWEQFLLAHARWFATAPGRALQEAVATA